MPGALSKKGMVPTSWDVVMQVALWQLAAHRIASFNSGSKVRYGMGLGPMRTTAAGGVWNSRGAAGGCGLGCKLD